MLQFLLEKLQPNWGMIHPSSPMPWLTRTTILVGGTDSEEELGADLSSAAFRAEMSAVHDASLDKWRLHAIVAALEHCRRIFRAPNCSYQSPQFLIAILLIKVLQHCNHLQLPRPQRHPLISAKPYWYSRPRCRNSVWRGDRY